MSGVGEVLAIVSCVAGLIQAYDAAGRTIERVKERRRIRQAAPPSAYLEKSVERGKKQIAEALEEGKERFGPEFEHGDDAARNALKDITIVTQNALLEGLTEARADDDVVDFSACINASDNGRLQALKVLHDYFLRKQVEEQEAAAARKTPAGASGGTQLQEERGQHSGHAIQPPASLPSPQRVPSSPAPETKRSRTLPFFRSSPRKNQQSTAQMVRPAPVSTQSEEASFRPLRTRTATGSTQTSSDSRQTTGSRTSSFPRQSTSSSDTYFTRSSSSMSDVMMPKPWSRSSSISVSPTASPAITSYGGCCKNAHFLRDGNVSKSLKLQTLTMTPGAINCNYRCPSRKCSFQVPAMMNKKREWSIDKRIRRWRGVLQYSPLFLAKSHVPMLEPLFKQSMKAQYRCIICILSHETTGILQGHDALFEHILDHAGAACNGIVLEGPLSFSNDGVSISADFDINLPDTSTAIAIETLIPVQSDHAITDPDLQHELEKLELGSKRSSYTSQDTDPYHNHWAEP